MFWKKKYSVASFVILAGIFFVLTSLPAFTFDFKRVIVDELKLLNNCFYDEKTNERELPINVLAEFLDRVTIHDNIKKIGVRYEIKKRL